MFTRAATVLLLVGLTAIPAAAQGRGKGKSKIPPGHRPPAGACRVWYDGVPPGHQPPATSCAEAERTAARQGNARVIYGDNSRSNRDYGYGGGDDRYGRDGRDDRYDRDDRYGRDEQWERENRRPRGGREGQDPSSQGANYGSAPFRKGYDDGLVKGREDAGDRDSYDPARHAWYRSANRGYDSRYGSREQYGAAYREGFLDGYQRAHRGGADTRRPGLGGLWPF
ncbi:MAG: hypothetical protein ABIP65_01970 [Vicinamibacterales bacterium]